MSDEFKPDVFIATPSYNGDVAAAYCSSLLGTCAALGAAGFSSQPYFISGNAIISFARAILVREFLKSGAEHMLCIDADLSWNPQSAVALVRSPHEFVGSIYPAKIMDMTKKVFQTRDISETGSQNLIETNGIPAGFMRIKRSAIEKMIKAYPEQRAVYKGKEIYLLFENMILEDGVPLGEDFAFCERWCRIGGKIFIYPDAAFAHYGRQQWLGNMIEDDKRLNIVN